MNIDVLGGQSRSSEFLAVNPNHRIPADISLYAFTHVAHEGRLSLEGFPAVRAWLERVVNQPGYVSILRVAADPDANPPQPDGLRWIPRVNGEFSVPVVTIHGLGDLYVPFINEQVYRERAEANGNGDMLVQRMIRSSPHCDFTGEELVGAFAAMADWEQNGSKPDGDDVLDADVVSDENYGCQFTSDTREGIPPARPIDAGVIRVTARRVASTALFCVCDRVVGIARKSRMARGRG